MIKRSDLKMQMRQEAKRVVPGARYGQVGHKSYRDAVEKGRHQLLQKSNVEGDATARRVRSEIKYLLNNYLPSYDARIEALIDQWRTSGDPAYDPAARGQLNRARREFNQKSHPL